jgi:hypothetical protein
MNFTVVIGNPPYNKGMDLDFIDIANEMVTNCIVMITPAKWQTAAENYRGCASKRLSYSEFRDKFVSHMSTVVYYPACKDIFDILQVDGISYFLIDKHNKYDKCIVINKSKFIDELNSETTRSILNRETLFNVGNDIINSLGEYKRFKFATVVNKKFCVWTNIKIPGGGLSTLESKRRTLFIGESHIESYDLSSKIEHSDASQCIFSSDDKDECESFISWLNCKFTQFFVAINVSKLTNILTNDCFRYVPAPPSGNFDHIYTDRELYKAFGLKQKYIDIIDKIIQERK